jgi:cell filamentation protein, protein adenylyltransferase
MNVKKLSQSGTGKLVKVPQGYWAFVPNPLPPKIEFSSRLVIALSEADRMLGALEGMGRTLPNPTLLVMPYARREAVLSSRIEGTQASLSDLFLFEAAKVKSEGSDVKEVANYVRAMNHGLKRLNELPLSLRLVREMHAKLLEGVRGQEQEPGEFRRSQNWVGPAGTPLDQAVYVPPPPSELHNVLGDWEKYLHERESFPPLIQCALMHSQFESIHPFVDGNGRVGRLLITLFLCERGHLSQPLLYLSGFLEAHRSEYYDKLQKIREEGDWIGWVDFFLRGVAEQARDALECAERILGLKERYRIRLQTKRATGTLLALLDGLFLNPYVTVAGAAKQAHVTFATAQSAINKLEDLKIVSEVTGSKRNRVYCAGELLAVIENRFDSPYSYEIKVRL